MANKLPYLPLYTGDYIKDPRLSLCSPATRGVWMDLLCAMHDLDRCGILRGTTEQLARLARCSNDQADHALNELQATRAADVTYRNNIWTVANRRMCREHSTREKRKQSGSQGGSKTQANREGTPYQIPEIVSEVDYENAREKAKLRVREFARGEGIGLADADWFFWKMESQGWMNRGENVRDWKAVIRCWWKAGWFPSRRQGVRQLPNGSKATDRSKIDVPERFKSWVAERYPAKRDEAMQWNTWADVPSNGLRDEWWREEKVKLGIL